MSDDTYEGKCPNDSLNLPCPSGKLCWKHGCQKVMAQQIVIQPPLTPSAPTYPPPGTPVPRWWTT